MCSCIHVSRRSNGGFESKDEDISCKVRLTGWGRFRFMVKIRFWIRVDFGHFRFRLTLMACVTCENSGPLFLLNLTREVIIIKRNGEHVGSDRGIDLGHEPFKWD